MLYLPPPSAPQIKIEWSERTIIFRRPAGDVIAVDGEVFGTLAIHPAWDEAPTLQPTINITHLPSKVRVAQMGSIQDAKSAVEWLWSQCRGAWVGDTVDKSKLTKEVMEWLQ